MHSFRPLKLLIL